MGANAIAFIRALGLSSVDVLGFSIGGMVAQEIARQAPELARKLILVGTGPRGADMSTSRSAEIFAGLYDPPEHLWLAVHFSPSPAGRAAGLAFLERKLRRKDRDPEVSEGAAARQREAIGDYVAGGEAVQDHLRDIRLPTLIVQGSNDVIIPTINSYVLQQKLPNAQLILYPDANHGSFYQYPDAVPETRDALPRRLTPSPAPKEHDHDHSHRQDRPGHRRLARHRCRDCQAAGGRWRERGDHLHQGRRGGRQGGGRHPTRGRQGDRHPGRTPPMPKPSRPRSERPSRRSAGSMCW